MAAIFYNLTQDKAVFKSGFPYLTPVSVDFLSEIINEDSMVIITTIGIHNNDTIQFFLSFDDLISHLYFGKGLGAITINGILFSDCDGVIPGLGKKGLYEAISTKRGKKVKVSCAGGATFTGIIVSFNTNTMAEPDVMTEFQITIQVIDQTLVPDKKEEVNPINCNKDVDYYYGDDQPGPLGSNDAVDDGQKFESDGYYTPVT